MTIVRAGGVASRRGRDRNWKGESWQTKPESKKDQLALAL
jgi:hypothetical protein